MSRRIEITEPASSGSGIPASTVTAKGDLIAATADATVTNLPVGTDTFVLTADSSQTTGLKWAASSGGGGVSSGLMWAAPGGPLGRYNQLRGITTSAGAGVAGLLAAIPVVWPVSATISEIGFETTALGTTGSVVRLGVYTNGTADQPDTLIVDAGTVATDGTTGVKSIAGLSVAVDAGVPVWIAVVPQVASPTFRTTGNTMLSLGSAAAPSTLSTTACHVYRKTSVTGALPTSFGTPVETTSGNAASSYMCFWKAS